MNAAWDGGNGRRVVVVAARFNGPHGVEFGLPGWAKHKLTAFLGQRGQRNIGVRPAFKDG
jgi:hypothetical protein